LGWSGNLLKKCKVPKKGIRKQPDNEKSKQRNCERKKVIKTGKKELRESI